MSTIEKLNPYHRALSLIWHRFFWDLKPKAWISRRRLNSLKNSYYGKKAVIACNGPSLLETNFELLRGTFVIGLNKINLIQEYTEFQPDIIVAINPLIIEQNREFYSKSNVPLYLDASASYLKPTIKSKAITYLHTADFPSFSRDCKWSVFQGYTVTYVALQLAFHLGFTRIALVGCDHKYDTNSVPNKMEKFNTQQSSHFSSNYFSENDYWQIPDLAQSTIYYALAKEAYANDGRKIFNATPNSALEVFPFIALDKFVDSNI